MKFKDLGLKETVLKAIELSGYTLPSPIQEKTIPIILKGKDVLGCAQTGTGKTAAFALPIIDQFLNSEDSERVIKALILTPTRELAIQIRDNFRKFSVGTNLKSSVILGGVNQKSQVEVLRKGVDILVATPGRLLDLINQKRVDLSKLKVLVLDEADTMLDMGFIHDVKKIINKTPGNSQTLLFSATMSNEIQKLSTSILTNPEIVKVNNDSLTATKIEQSMYMVEKSSKPGLLLDILKEKDITSSLIFTRTKHGANKLSDFLKINKVSSGVIHGNKSQSARVLALDNFKKGKTKILVATDIAARGIDISEISHVINFDIPEQAETYVHRIGRTGRAGFSGMAISLCSPEEQKLVREIEKVIKKTIPRVHNHDFSLTSKITKPKLNKSNKVEEKSKTRENNKLRENNKIAKSNKTMKNNKNSGNNKNLKNNKANKNNKFKKY